MVHALQESWRVLKPDAILIDLRPAAAPYQICVTRQEHLLESWSTSLGVDETFAANRALSHVVKKRLFQPLFTTRFLCTLIVPTYKLLRDWIYDPQSVPQVDLLISQVRNAMKNQPSPSKIELRTWIMLRVLEKRGAPAW